MNKISLRKKFDSLLAPVTGPVARLLFHPAKRTAADFRSILVIRPGGIGDAVLLIPAIRALKKTMPHAVIDILAEKRNAEVFSLCPDVSSVLCYDKFSHFMKAVTSGYDAAIDTEQWHRLSAVTARMTRAPVMIGFGTNDRRKLFTHVIRYSHDDYEVDSFFRLINPLTGSIEFDAHAPFLSVSQLLNQKARTLLQPLAGRRLAAIFPGSSIQERKWGSRRFRQLAELLTGQDCGIVVIGGKEDFREGGEIAAHLENTLNLCGKVSLSETAAVLQECGLLITGDSGIMHIGYGLGIKIVALFGPGREKKWAPPRKNCVVINRQLECSPCTTYGYTAKCRKNAQCMKEITAGEVFGEALKLLERGQKQFEQ